MRRVNLLLGGWTAIVLLFLYAPIVLLVVYSFNRSRLNITWQGFTLQWYRDLWHDRPLIGALTNSLLIAAVTTVASVVLGTAGAWLSHRYRFPLGRALATLILVPMVIPEVIMGVSLLIFFSLASGWGNQLLARWGVTSSEPLGLGFATIIIAHVTFCFPFVLVAVEARLAGLDPALEEAAMDLGATPWQAFARVIVPYLLPAIVSGALMAFTLSLDELIVTYFVKSPASETLPVKVYGMAKVGLNPMLNAISAIFIVATIVLVIAANWITRGSASLRIQT
jgi:spermidine/putrescine transport system permease protein